MMQSSSATEEFLHRLSAFSGNTLSRPDDLALLIDIAATHDKAATLDELSFLAKFLHKTYGIMKRIGREAQGYDRLSTEFAASMERARELLEGLLSLAPPERRQEADRQYLAMTPESLQNLLSLFHDLGWLKNWQIDHPS